MVEQRKRLKGYVKNETTILAAFIALVIGFIGGAVFSVFRLDNLAPMPSDQPAKQMTSISQEQEAEISRLVAQTKETPDDPQAWAMLGHLYFDTKQLKKAIHAYETSLKLNPQNADLLTDLGVMYRRDGDPKKAVQAFDKAMEIDPRHEISRFNKGIVMLHDLEDTTGAIAAWEGLLTINPQAKAPNGQTVKELIEHFKTHE
jgi:cytochrome c-type biogenesis protein CcmH/NrfG